MMKKKFSKIFRTIMVGIFLFLPACTLSKSSVPPSTPIPTQFPSPTSTIYLTSAPSPTLTAETTITPLPSPTSSPTPVAEHRIGIRYVHGLGEFYDKVDNSKFVPRGMNYARLDHVVGSNQNWHSTFDPNLYDPNKIDQALERMESDGYNVVRVFIDCCSTSGQVGDPKHGLSYAYMEKVVDFLWRAKAHNIFVILIIDGTPALGGYNDVLWSRWFPNIGGNNLRYLTTEGLLAKDMYMTDFVRALIDRQAPLDTIFAYDLSNEVYFELNNPPFSLSSGLVFTGNAKTYDMSKPEEKTSMAIDNMIYWIDNLRESILYLDPTALVEVSFFAPLARIPTNLGDSYISLPGAVIARSQADFIELHPYPGKGFDLQQYATYYGIAANTPKPVVMGEFGVWKSAFNSAASAAQFLQNWQIESCQYGYDGWLLWTWDSEDGLWNALSQNGEIEKALAPITRPDPCK